MAASLDTRKSQQLILACHHSAELMEDYVAHYYPLPDDFSALVRHINQSLIAPSSHPDPLLLPLLRFIKGVLVRDNVDHYRCLGLPDDATDEAAAAHFRAFLNLLQNDSELDTEQLCRRVKRLSAAYSVVGDSVQRRLYDRSRGHLPARDRVELPLQNITAAVTGDTCPPLSQGPSRVSATDTVLDSVAEHQRREWGPRAAIVPVGPRQIIRDSSPRRRGRSKRLMRVLFGPVGQVTGLGAMLVLGAWWIQARVRPPVVIEDTLAERFPPDGRIVVLSTHRRAEPETSAIDGQARNPDLFVAPTVSADQRRSTDAGGGNPEMALPGLVAPPSPPEQAAALPSLLHEPGAIASPRFVGPPRAAAPVGDAVPASMMPNTRLITLPQLADLATRFARYYEEANVDQLMALFAEQARANDIAGAERIRQEYVELFKATERRQFRFDRLDWQISGDSARGYGEFSANIYPKWKAQPVLVRGAVRFDVVLPASNQPTITGLYHENSTETPGQLPLSVALP